MVQDQRIFYRLTTVASDRRTGDVLETPLESAGTADNRRTEKLDWVWTEAVRRNRFMLTQAGERVKLFVRKAVGPRCGCYSDSNRQPASDCRVCFGTSIIGGYEGPFDILVAPEDGERASRQSNRGRTIENTYDSWTGPSPLLSQRDFIVKANGDRYVIGPITGPRFRDILLQQMFQLSRIDDADIRGIVPVVDTTTLVYPQTRYFVPGHGRATPMITNSQVPADRQIRGLSPAAENTYRR